MASASLRDSVNDAKETNEDESDSKRNTQVVSSSENDRRESITSDESYDPFKHRDVPKKTSDVGALAHLLKTSLGSGILAMPMAIKNSGLVLGAIGTLLIGVVCTHCLQLLIYNSQELCRKARVPQLGYAETMENAFIFGPEKMRKWAKAMKVLVITELLLSFILGNTVYVVFMADSMKQIFEFYFHYAVNVRFYMLALWIPLICMCLLRTLKSLVPFSILANIFVILSFLITLYYIFRDINPVGDKNFVSPCERWPFFLTTVVFSLEGIGTLMSIENEMENPRHLLEKNGRCCGILYIAMTIVVTVYAVIGFFGYLEYGEDTQGSITLNLPIKEPLAQTVKILIPSAIFFTYALQFYVPINITKSQIIEAVKKTHKVNEKYFIYIDIGVRVGLVSFTIIAAAIVPQLEPIITLVGAICFSMLGLMFPSIIDSLVRYPAYGRFKWKFVKNIIISTFSLVVLVCGTYAGIRSVLEVYAGLNN